MEPSPTCSSSRTHLSTLPPLSSNNNEPCDKKVCCSSNRSISSDTDGHVGVVGEEGGAQLGAASENSEAARVVPVRARTRPYGDLAMMGDSLAQTVVSEMEGEEHDAVRVDDDTALVEVGGGAPSPAIRNEDPVQQPPPLQSLGIGFSDTFAGLSRRRQPRRVRKEKFDHHRDYDSCLYMTIRKSEWFVRLFDRVPRTSPMHYREILASFSIKNVFMFYPPPKTYGFTEGEDGSVMVRETGELPNSEDDEERMRREEQFFLSNSANWRKTRPDNEASRSNLRTDYESRPGLDPSKHNRATHGIRGLGTYMTPSGRRSKFEMVFIPWRNEVQAYRIVKDEVILERVMRVGSLPFCLSLGCPIPCSIIRPNCRMSSHVAIFFHCNGEDIGHSSCLRLQTLANALHMTILVPEYPGYGLFRGAPSEASVKAAMERVVQFLFLSDGSFTPSRLLLIGHSIGGAVAVHVAEYIQEVFERLQAHCARDVPCPGTYSNELVEQGKPSFFESYQSPGGNNSFQSPDVEQRQAQFSSIPVASGAAGEEASTCRNSPPRSPNAPYGNGEGGDEDASSGGEAPLPGRVLPRGGTQGQGERARPTTKVEPSPSSSWWCGLRCGGCCGKSTTPSTVTHCRHNALGGIILISTFTSLRSVEYVPTFENVYHLHPTQLEVRRREVPCDGVFPAPVSWREDASARIPVEEMGFPYEEMTTPCLYKVSRFLSFNRFPTTDVLCRLQEKYRYFNHTPMLLIHGTEDDLVSPVHTVAMASKVRQCRNGGDSARVFLTFVADGGHNELPCIRQIRRFYKDEILVPHLDLQRKFKERLTDLYQSGREQMAASTRSASMRTSPRVERARTGSPPPPPAELYFLSHDPTLTAPPPARMDSMHTDSSWGAGQASPRLPHHRHGNPGGGHGPLDRHISNPTSGLITREDSAFTVGSEVGGAETARVGPHDRDVYGPFIYRDSGSFAEPDAGSSAVKNSSLLHTLYQVKGPMPLDSAEFAPASTMLHMSMCPKLDHYDVGSVLMASVRANTLSKEDAHALYVRHRRLAWVWRSFAAAVFLAASLVVLSIGITHAVLSRPDHLVGYVPPGHTAEEYRRDDRVLAWCILESVMLALCSVMHLLRTFYGMTSVSRERERRSHASFRFFAILQIIVLVMVLGISIVMSFVLSFTPHTRGGGQLGEVVDLAILP